MDTRRFSAAMLAASFAVAFLAFARALTAGFVGDDWYFLDIVTSGSGVGAAVQPLAGRFLRPLVVLAYLVPYRLFGLHSLASHALIVSIHALNTWLVFLLATSLASSGERLRPALAALIFAVFAGHSEAIAWYASIADPLMTLFALTTLVLAGRAVTAVRPGRWMIGACATFLLALASKESAIVLPAIVAIYALVNVERKAPASIRRALAMTAVMAALALGYLVLRIYLFGAIFGAYAGFATSTGVHVAAARAFLLRSFLPPGATVSRLWVSGQDVWLFVIGALALACAFTHGVDRRALLFASVALVFALAPALPLTISLSNTVSERFVYAATAFSSILVVWIVWRASPRPWIATVLLVAFAAYHARGLTIGNRTWSEAARLFDGVLESTVARLREHDPAGRRPVFILTLPDNLRGAFVFRNGFYPAVRLTAPDILAPEQRIVGVTSHDTARIDDETIVQRVGPTRYTIDIGANLFVQTSPPNRPPYRFVEWTQTRCTLEFVEPVSDALILYATRDTVAVVR